MSIYVWLAVGIGLLLAEFAAPGLIVAFFGAAALSVAGLMAAGLLEGIGAQFGTFAFLSVVYLVALRDIFKRWFQGFTSDESAGELDVDDIRGQHVRAIQDFSDGQGRVSYNGVVWQAECNGDLSEGDRATIVGKNSLVLILEKES